jgi:hypothetical protein
VGLKKNVGIMGDSVIYSNGMLLMGYNEIWYCGIPGWDILEDAGIYNQVVISGSTRDLSDS